MVIGLQGERNFGSYNLSFKKIGHSKVQCFIARVTVLGQCPCTKWLHVEGFNTMILEIP